VKSVVRMKRFTPVPVTCTVFVSENQFVDAEKYTYGK
jgi:hypothetical protein